MRLTKEGIEILQNVKAHILEEPRRLNMSSWGYHGKVGVTITKDGYASECLPYEFPECGTVACIAGWVVLLKTGNLFGHLAGVRCKASWLLTNYEYASMSDLFFVDSWDSKFRRKYESAKTPQEKAQVTADYIDFYIAKNDGHVNG